MNHYILKILKQSVSNLIQNNPELNAGDLEAEIINIASYIFLKDSNEIDFSLDYLDQDSIDALDGNDYEIVDEIIDAATILFSKYYSERHAVIAKQGVRMNIQLAEDYGSFLKSYFISKHKISVSSDYQTFSSPNNSLWESGVKKIDSPTQRDINYKFDFDNNAFEILINPYNPLVTGKILSKTDDKVKCRSFDNTREFEFLLNSGQLYEVIMHRIDKGDMIKYHQ
jgi:hypothetical protein